jgi:hypothetical protein
MAAGFTILGEEVDAAFRPVQLGALCQYPLPADHCIKSRDQIIKSLQVIKPFGLHGNFIGPRHPHDAYSTMVSRQPEETLAHGLIVGNRVLMATF